MDFDPEGSRLISGSFDETVLVWDCASDGDVLLSLRGHETPVVEVAFGEGGERIVSGSTDGDVLVWETARASERFLARQAAELVERRLAGGESLEAVQASIEGDPQLGEALVREALSYASVR